jgi:hypothetical protein
MARLKMDIPETLVADCAADPMSPYGKVLMVSKDRTSPLNLELTAFLAGLPSEEIEAAYADSAFAGLYDKNENLARVWIAERLLIEEAARRRLRSLADISSPAEAMPYTADCVRGVRVDDECMVRLAAFEYNGSTLATNGFSFTVCPTNTAPNSTYWLLQSFYEQGVAEHMSVRLDPFLWGPSDSFPQMMFKMLVYARPLDWDGIGKLRKQHHGQMRPDRVDDRSERTEFCWEPRNDGVHFTSEELPSKKRIDF